MNYTVEFIVEYGYWFIFKDGIPNLAQQYESESFARYMCKRFNEMEEDE